MKWTKTLKYRTLSRGLWRVGHTPILLSGMCVYIIMFFFLLLHEFVFCCCIGTYFGTWLAQFGVWSTWRTFCEPFLGKRKSLSILMDFTMSKYKLTLVPEIWCCCKISPVNQQWYSELIKQNYYGFSEEGGRKMKLMCPCPLHVSVDSNKTFSFPWP